MSEFTCGRGGHSTPGYSVPPTNLNQRVCFHFLCSSPAKGGTLTQATMSHPTDQLRGTLTQATVSHPTTKLRGALTQATLSHQAKVHTRTQAAAVQLRGLLPRLECPTQQSSQGGHSDPGYSVPPYNRAKGGSITQATLSHQAKVYTLTQS